MLLSVAAPVHRAQGHLRATLESVLGQGVDGPEPLVVDDGPRDGSARIAAEFAARDPRVGTGALLLRAHYFYGRAARGRAEHVTVHPSVEGAGSRRPAAPPPALSSVTDAPSPELPAAFEQGRPHRPPSSALDAKPHDAARCSTPLLFPRS
ncbi:glycosyltransferase family 2 protein [Streptomyces sp. NPDC002476]|uniref:glycosyltransferase family 2 protein n=1 Tax=Streptomyces sp. NPDC002476 TaxID=3364648 RepID=UPI00367AFB9D